MAKNSPETESSIIYFRQIGRLHAETVDMMRISIKDLDGTHDGAIYNQLMKHFLHNNATKALAFLREKVSIDGFPPEHPFTLASGMIQNYLGALPLSQDQIIVDSPIMRSIQILYRDPHHIDSFGMKPTNLSEIYYR